MASESRNPFEDTPNFLTSFIGMHDQPEKSSRVSISVHPVSENDVSIADDENVPSYFQATAIHLNLLVLFFKKHISMACERHGSAVK